MCRAWLCSECGQHRPVFQSRKNHHPRRDKDHSACFRCYHSFFDQLKAVQILDFMDYANMMYN